MQEPSEIKKTTTSSASKFYEIWWVQRLGAAFGTGLLAVIFSWWFSLCHPFSGFLIVFALVAAVLLHFGNPERRFFRAATTSVGAAVGLIIIQFGFSFQWTQNIQNGNFRLLIEKLTEYEWLIAMVLICLSFYLFYLDAKKNDSMP